MGRAGEQKANGRRTWGRGTIEQRGPKRWVVRVSHRRDPITGKRVRESRTVRGTKRAAERLLAELVRSREIHGAIPGASGQLTLDAWMRKHISTGLSPKTGEPLSPRTRADQSHLWSLYSTPQVRGTPLRDVSTAMLAEHVARLRAQVSRHTGRRLSARTVQLYFGVVKAALHAAVLLRLLPANPATGIAIKGGTAVSKRTRALTPTELHRVLTHNPDDRLAALWQVAAATGMRPGELIALRWEDWHEAERELHVRRTFVRVGKQRYFAPCKADSEREIPVDAALAVVLERHRTRQATERARLGEHKWVDPELMFTNEIGGVLDQTNLATAFRARVKAAGVRPARWYDLRHSYGTHLIAAGEDAKTVASLLGHRDVSTTLRHYVHTDETRKRSAVETLASYREARPA